MCGRRKEVISPKEIIFWNLFPSHSGDTNTKERNKVFVSTSDGALWLF